jgi:hypothetical protein
MINVAMMGAVVLVWYFPAVGGCVGNEFLRERDPMTANVMGQSVGPKPFTIGQLSIPDYPRAGAAFEAAA